VAVGGLSRHIRGVTSTPTVVPRLSAALADRYRIERELGIGGMATVYLARDLRHDRDVAIKVLHPELGAALGGERFLAEIRTTARLQHPHILPLLDSGEVPVGHPDVARSERDGPSLLYYVMPYVAGETLRRRLERERQLPLDDALRIAREVADALQHAHSAGIIHRDIKPENILLQGGHALVADFGIALAVQQAGGQRMTQTGLSLGTPQYMSPEQAMGEKVIDARTDIYALGAVTYEMLAGDPPFTGSSVQAIVAKVLAERPTPLHTLRDTVPPAVEQATLKALAKLPADRFATAAEMIAALGASTGGAAMPHSAGASGATAGVPRWAFVATAAIAIASLGFGAWSWMRPAPSAPVSRFNIVLPDSQTLVPNENVTRITLSPDGRTLAYLGYDSRNNGRWRIYVRRLERLTAEPIVGTEDAINPSFSPDGKQIAFVIGTMRRLKVVSLAGQPPQVLTDSLVDLGGVAWGTDHYVYYDGHLAGDGLARIHDTGGQPEIATRAANPADSWHSAPRALPNGRGVLFMIAHDRGAGPADIGVLDTRTGNFKVLLRGVAPRYVEPGYLLYVTESGTLMAVRFDLERLTLSGDPVPVLDGVAVSLRGGADLEVTPNGTLIYAAGESVDRQRELVQVALDGRVTAIDSSWRADIRAMALSPDGRAVAVTVPRGEAPELWIKPLDRGPPVKITDVGGPPAWSPDGRELAYAAAGGIFVGPSDGSALPRLRYPGTYSLFTQLAYSPDGKWIVGTLGGDVVGFHTTGDPTIVPLVKSPALERRPTISPDGRWLAYESDESGRLEVYVRPFPNVESAKRQISTTGGAIPRWSPDGRALVYFTERQNVVTVPVTLSPTFSAGAPRVLFNGAGLAGQPVPFDVLPGGKGFIMSRRLGGAATGPGQLVVVENFRQELEERLPPSR
jgi:serine/threonine-protein kinase